MNSVLYEILKVRYENHFVRIDQLRRYVLLGRLTEAEFTEITGEAYSV